jgi:hypothetical protein
MADIQAAAEQWQTQGWVLVHDLVPVDDIDLAVNELWELFPTPDEYHSGSSAARTRFETQSTDDRYKPTDNRAAFEEAPLGELSFRARQFLGLVMFPYSSMLLNRLHIHPNVVSFAQLAMEETDLRLYQARTWGKYTGVTDYDQPFHQDRNHNIVPDRLEKGWWNMEGFLYLSDVEDGVGATEILGNGVTLPEGKPISASGRRGSFLAYRPDIWHRGVNLTKPGGARFIMSTSFRNAGHDWIGFDSFQQHSNRGPWSKFAASCSPEELALFGAPLPGHPYWTPDLVDAFEERYKGIDASPWRNSLPL